MERRPRERQERERDLGQYKNMTADDAEGIARMDSETHEKRQERKAIKKERKAEQEIHRYNSYEAAIAKKEDKEEARNKNVDEKKFEHWEERVDEEEEAHE
uniref:Uncharacterized protein n=1 Tax=Palpitomonas bilix TaxID=652834 RepID=A0A7S3GED0_9EUKA|mmetsp:Transcript_45792/g.118349  ORF Transcript_45792/g.118349 Transcript_45792/m.118349 type:complete len:101 (+) Transcript_45792:68-370(+)